MQVRVKEGDRAAVRQARSVQKVAGARTHVEVPVTDVPPVPIDEPRGGASPHDRGEEAEDDGVVDPQEARRVLALAPVGRVVTLHRDRVLPRGHPAGWIDTG